jgi:predicted PurR-regulated permease PerM
MKGGSLVASYRAFGWRRATGAASSSAMSAPEPSPSLLSATQRKLVGFAAALLAVAVTLALLVGAVAGLGRLLAFFSGVLWPLAVAGILALILRPAVDAIEARLKFHRVTAVIMLYGAAALALTAFIVVVVPPLLDQLDDLVQALPELWQRALAWTRGHLPGEAKNFSDFIASPTVKDLGKSLSTEAQKLLGDAGSSLALAGAGLLAVIGFVTHVLLVPFYLFFLLLLRGGDGKGLARALGFLPPVLRDDVTFLTREFVGIVVAFFRGQLLIGAIIGVLYAIGFTLVGLKFGFVLGLVLGLLNVVPYLGTLTCLATALPIALLQTDGGWKLAGLVLAVMGAVQATEGWVLTPRIMGRQTGLHPMAITVAIFFWGTALGGLPGLVLAVPLTAFLVTAWRFARKKYFNADAPEPLNR